MYEHILTEVDQGVGIVTLNRPARQNALDNAMLNELTQAFERMDADPAVQVMVLSGTGNTFSLGIPVEHPFSIEAAASMLQALAHMNKPTLARIHGAARGLGVGLIAACDVAIATFDADFSIAGLAYAELAPFIVDAIGTRAARRYMLTTEVFAATEAYRLGLLSEMAADSVALDEALAELISLLMIPSAAAQAGCKQVLRNKK